MQLSKLFLHVQQKNYFYFIVHAHFYQPKREKMVFISNEVVNVVFPEILQAVIFPTSDMVRVLNSTFYILNLISSLAFFFVRNIVGLFRKEARFLDVFLPSFHLSKKT